MKDDLLNYFKYPWKDLLGNTWKSPYMAALIDARKVTSRNIRTGKKLNRDHGCWLGALGYMALVDHVGGIIKLKNKSNSDNDFISALKQFTNLNEKERKALYALRCSFAHNYHLYNNNTKDENKIHHFTVTSGSKSDSLIIFPQEKWDGDHETKISRNKTIINFELFGDLVEEMHKNIIKKIEDDKVEVVNQTLIETYIVY